MSSYLFCPSNIEKYIDNAINSNATVIVPDLEDSVPNIEKNNALDNILNLLKSNAIKDKIIIPRIDTSYLDIELQVRKLTELDLHGLIIPDVQNSQAVKKVIKYIDKSILGKISIIPLIESINGINNLKSIIQDNNINTIAFGKYDLGLSLSINSEESDKLIDYIKLRFVYDSLSLSCLPIDTPELNINNINLFKEKCIISKSMGFKAKFAVHPTQLDIINDIFNSSEYNKDEIIFIINEFENLSSKGIGTFKFKNNIIDLPVYKHLKNIYRSKRYDQK
jgi:citrate lyase beta subunit